MRGKGGQVANTDLVLGLPVVFAQYESFASIWFMLSWVSLGLSLISLIWKLNANFNLISLYNVNDDGNNNNNNNNSN